MSIIWKALLYKINAFLINIKVILYFCIIFYCILFYFFNFFNSFILFIYFICLFFLFYLFYFIYLFILLILYYIVVYWEYKLVRSVQKCIYFKTKWMNRSIKVHFIAVYYFFPSLRQFSNSISKKWLVFEGDPILEPIFDFCERNEPVTCCILRNNQ